MSFIKKMLNRETVSYLIFGILTTIVSYVAYFIFDHILVGVNIRTALATALAWIIAVSFAYITNKLFVFNSKSFKKNVLIKEILGFIMARVTSLIFEIIFMVIAVDVIFYYCGLCKGIGIIEYISQISNVSYDGIYKFISKGTANVFIVIINYFFSKLFIFKNNNGGKVVEKD